MDSGERVACLRSARICDHIYLRDLKSFFKVVVLHRCKGGLFYISYIFISKYVKGLFPSRLRPLFCKYVFRYLMIIKNKSLRVLGQAITVHAQ